MKKFLLLGLILLFSASLTFAQIGMYGNTVNNLASDYSSACGIGNTSTGYSSFAGGSGSWSTGDRSFSFGNYVKATATNAMVFGSGSNIYGKTSFLENNIANSFMVGFNNARLPSLFVQGFDNSGNLGYVGIHTTSPRSTLDVVGTLTVDDMVFANGSPSIGDVLTCKGADGTVTWETPTGGGTNIGGVTGSGANGYIPNWNGTGSDLESSPIYTDGSSVGIGTASLISTLTVSGTIRASGVIYASGGNSSNWNTAYSWGDHASAGYLTSVGNNSHTHTGSTISGLTGADISGLTTVDFTSANVSQWTNDAGYISDGNTGWDNIYGFVTTSNDNDDINIELNNSTIDGSVYTLDFQSPLTVTTDGSSEVNIGFANPGYITDGNDHWDNSYGFITDGNTGWNNSYGFITDGNTGWNNSYGFITDGNTHWDNTYGFITALELSNYSFGDVSGPASSTNNAIARFDGTTGKVIQNSSTTIDDNGNVKFTAGNGRGINFWNSGSYAIYMSAYNDATNGGRLSANSDYNMYFKMTGGTNRGFVFKNGNTSVAQIDGTGKIWSAIHGNSAEWNEAYGWGNHASEGYITDGNTHWDNIYGFITGYTETDPIYSAWDKDYNDLINKPIIPGGNSTIDWTINQGATNIHTGNYIDNNTTYTETQLNQDDVTLADVQSATTNDFHNIGGVDANTTYTETQLNQDDVTLADVKTATTNDFHNIGGVDANTTYTETQLNQDDVTLADVKTAASNDFHNIGGVDANTTYTEAQLNQDDVTFQDVIDALGFTPGNGTGDGDVTSTGTTGYIPKFTSVNNIGNSSIFDDGTKVGIGTNTPSSELDVNGIIKATGGNSTNWSAAYSWGNHAAAGYLTTIGDLTISGDVTGNLSDAVVIDDSHNHSSASISGLNADDFASQAISQWDNDAGYITSQYSHPNHTGHVTSTGDGNTRLNASAIYDQTDGKPLVASDLMIYSDGSDIYNFEISDIQTYMQSHLTFDGGTNSLWIESGNDIYIDKVAPGALQNANVGIGIATPQARLDVVGTTKISSTLNVGGTITAKDGINMLGTTNKIVFGEESNSIFQIARNSASKGIDPPPAGSQVDILTIDANNDIGIGTTSPVAKLDVNGDVNIGTTLYVEGDVTTNGNAIVNQDISVQGNAQLSGELNLGIGSTEINFGESNVARTLKIVSKYSEASKSMIRGLAVAPNGHVGIGIDNPTKSLEVDGTVKASGFQMTDGNALNGKILQSDASGVAAWVDPSTLSGVGIWSGDASEAYYSGSVGIGTTNVGTHKLAVNGSINATLVRVTETVPSSDYVFETDYSLMPLNELESFVKTNKHLPEVMSAEEFAKNGYSLGEMDDILLRKVEELTLHAIEQNKQLKQQQVLLEKQQKLIDQLLEATK